MGGFKGRLQGSCRRGSWNEPALWKRHSYVRFGEDVYGAMVPEGKADVILSFEPVEALRYINYLKKGGLVFTNARPIPPVQVSMGGLATIRALTR